MTAIAQAQLSADETVFDAPVIGSSGGRSLAKAIQTERATPKRASAARYLWAALIARIYEVKNMSLLRCCALSAQTK